MKKSEAHHDAQTLDTATAEQQEEQGVPNLPDEKDAEAMEEDEDIKPLDDEETQV